MASFKFDLSAFDRLRKRLEDPAVRDALLDLPRQKGIAALVGQAIADNFAQQGPGWVPLSRAYLSRELSRIGKANEAEVAKLHDQLSRVNKKLAKKPGSKRHHDQRSGILDALQARKVPPSKMILQTTGLLKKSVTTPGAEGNVWRQEGTKLIWGTDLIYAAIHNKGGTILNGFGRGIRINIPKREFLVLRPFWMQQLQEYAIKRAKSIVQRIAQ